MNPNPTLNMPKNGRSLGSSPDEKPMPEDRIIQLINTLFEGLSERFTAFEKKVDSLDTKLRETQLDQATIDGRDYNRRLMEMQIQVDALRADLSVRQEKTDDRLRPLESSINKIYGVALGVSIFSGVATGLIVHYLTHK